MINTFSFNDANWRPFPQEKCDALGVTPNQLWANTSSNAGALVVKKSPRYAEYAVSEAGLNYLHAAVQAGKITTGHLVLVTWSGGKLTVVQSKPRRLLLRLTGFRLGTGLLACTGGSTLTVRQMECAHWLTRRID
jgi:hypothetical protein